MTKIRPSVSKPPKCPRCAKHGGFNTHYGLRMHMVHQHGAAKKTLKR